MTIKEIDETRRLETPTRNSHFNDRMDDRTATDRQHAMTNNKALNTVNKSESQAETCKARASTATVAAYK